MHRACFKVVHNILISPITNYKNFIPMKKIKLSDIILLTGIVFTYAAFAFFILTLYYL